MSKPVGNNPIFQQARVPQVATEPGAAPAELNHELDVPEEEQDQSTTESTGKE